MLEPVAFEKALDSYLDSQSTEEIRALVLRSIKRLDGAHRVQLALFLGLDVAGDPIMEVGGSAIDDVELGAFIESCGLLRERFGAFLRDNPRAIRALGRTASERILGKPERVPFAFFRRVPPRVAAAVTLALFVTFVPLAAQYEHQRGMTAGPSDAAIAPPIVPAPPVHVASVPAKPPQRTARAQAVFAQPLPAPVHHAVGHRSVRPHHVATIKHPRATHVAVAKPKHARRRYIASEWKFDPKWNPYFNRSAWHVVHFVGRRPTRSTRQSIAAVLPPGFEGRASLVVSSYLHAVIEGNTASALHHLGLPADASRTNLSEMPIVTRDTRARVVSVDAQPDGRAKVEVDINGRAGEYFEVFYVDHDGPAVRIMDRFYIPVNRTAEERAAHLLAKDGH